MGTIYSPPASLKLPTWDFTKPAKDYFEDEKRYLNELSNLLKERNPNEKYVGDTISFPVADGKAVYMVASLKPIKLVHLPLGDAWQFEFAHRLTKKDIIQKIEQEKKIQELFSKK